MTEFLTQPASVASIICISVGVAFALWLLLNAKLSDLEAKMTGKFQRAENDNRQRDKDMHEHLTKQTRSIVSRIVAENKTEIDKIPAGVHHAFTAAFDQIIQEYVQPENQPAQKPHPEPPKPDAGSDADAVSKKIIKRIEAESSKPEFKARADVKDWVLVAVRGEPGCYEVSNKTKTAKGLRHRAQAYAITAETKKGAVILRFRSFADAQEFFDLPPSWRPVNDLHRLKLKQCSFPDGMPCFIKDYERM